VTVSCATNDPEAGAITVAVLVLAPEMPGGFAPAPVIDQAYELIV
jgi:hypothetical protein